MLDNFLNALFLPEVAIGASSFLVLAGITASLFPKFAAKIRWGFLFFAVFGATIVAISTGKQYQMAAETQAARDDYLATLRAEVVKLKGLTTEVNQLTKESNTNIHELTTGAATTISKFDSLNEETAKISNNMNASAQALSKLVNAAKASGAASDKHYQRLMAFAEATAKAQRDFLECLTDQIAAAQRGTVGWYALGCSYTPPKTVEQGPTVPQTAP